MRAFRFLVEAWIWERVDGWETFGRASVRGQETLAEWSAGSGDPRTVEGTLAECSVRRAVQL